MRIKKYTAKSMKEALLQIKQELGEDAIILKTSHSPGKLFSQGDIEVTAAVDESAQADANASPQAFAPLRVSSTGVYKRPKPAPEMPLSDSKADSADRRKEEVLQREKPSAVGGTDLDKKYETIKADIGELKRLLDAAVKGQDLRPRAAEGLSGHWALLYKRLVDAEVLPEDARSFVTSICSDPLAGTGDVVQRFVGSLDACFTHGTSGQKAAEGSRIIMFVGPTGSGKTTTLAKLAAHHALNGRKTVSVITADTYRIAAIEQIRTFTDIMNVDLHIVFSPDEAVEALGACASQDIVFFDTAGRSQRSGEHMDELATLIKRTSPHEVHCVLSAATKTSDLIATIEKYAKLGANRLLFTKLDETMKLGNVFTAAIRSKIPLSYFTFGQRVPDDIELAQPHRLVTRLFEGGSL